ncbi:poly(R)-hydroxyalkanoic acid synthase subunit PhaE [Peptoniphilus sp.]|uniref:poly(R)-hydroxyalkanoic acid synthase subunit PhaE n=1 Tax=Peptoniphilus sp. TaxID=1971214 RepID=UPI002A830278|nr:poly(R)-hydroxyalkanoic acid synthase subunit PhaE [Peptoniphilus sp.]MDY3902232.1 poly(R)-hydroxyalkanoic acid synthase subunit PhaE [Peptoniphilus sp.]
MENKNFFEEMMEMQKNIFENQKEAYNKFMESFKFGDFKPFGANMFVNNFKNPMEFFNNYKEMNEKFENNFREFFSQVPGYEDSLESYKKNMEFLNKLYFAYDDFYKDFDLVAAQNKLIELFELYSDELVEMSKKYFYKLIPDSYYRILENFNLEKFIRPVIENSKRSIDFYENAIKNRPELLVSDVKDFYQGILDKIFEMPTIGVSPEEKEKSKRELQNYLDLELKLLDFNLFLEKKNQETALKAQRAYIDGLETEASLEDFADFYKFYMNNFEKAYKELVNSEEYKEKAQEILDIVEKNKEAYKERLVEKLADFPIATARDAEKFMSEVEGLTKKFDDEKRAKTSLERKVTKIKTDSEKEIKALKEEVEKLKEENAKKKVEADEAVKKEIEELKKEIAALKKNK